MDDLDRRLINRLQHGLPLVRRTLAAGGAGTAQPPE